MPWNKAQLALLLALTLGACSSVDKKTEPTPVSAAEIGANETAAPDTPQTEALPVTRPAPNTPPKPFTDAQAYRQAQGALEQGDLDEAQRILKALTQKYPNKAGPWANLGIVYLKLARLDEAEQALQQAVALNDALPETKNMLGVVYRKKGKIERAKTLYLDALKLDPDYAIAHYNLAVLNDIYLQDPGQALEHYSRYMELTGGADQQVAQWIEQLRKRVQ